TRLHMVLADAPGRAGRIGVEHGGVVTQRLRRVHEHAPELAAAQYAERGAGQDGRRPLHSRHGATTGWGGRVMSRAISVCAARKALRRWRNSGSSLASSATANSAALAAP